MARAARGCLGLRGHVSHAGVTWAHGLRVCTSERSKCLGAQHQSQQGTPADAATERGLDPAKQRACLGLVCVAVPLPFRRRVASSCTARRCRPPTKRDTDSELLAAGQRDCARPVGWSSGEVFMQRMKEVFMKEVAPPPPPPLSQHAPGSGSGGESAETRGRRVWTGLCYRAARTTEHMWQTLATPTPFTATKGCPTRQHTPPNTRAHGITATPILDHPHGPVPQPSQRYKPHSLLDWTRENDGSKKTQKCGNMGPPCADKPAVGQGGEGKTAAEFSCSKTARFGGLEGGGADLPLASGRSDVIRRSSVLLSRTRDAADSY